MPQKWRIVLPCYISYISFWISTFCSFIVSLDYCLFIGFPAAEENPFSYSKVMLPIAQSSNYAYGINCCQQGKK